MNDKQNSYLNMFQAVNEVLQSNRSKYETIPVFNSMTVELKENIEKIRETDKKRSGIIVPASTAVKQTAEDHMINNAVITARVINVYAFDTGDKELQMQTGVTKSRFYNLHANDKLALARTIMEKANSLAAVLADYGMDQEKLELFAEAVNNYNELIVKPRESINERKGQTNNLSQLFADTKSLLNDRLDKLMGLFKESEPDFYQAYFYARNVINTAYRRTNAGQGN